MKHLSAILLIPLFLATEGFAQHASRVVTTDIDNFWAAYDKVVATKDKGEQLGHLNQLFIDKGTPGLRGIMAARQYSPVEYVDAINKYPLFWKSIRENTLKARSFANEIEVGVEKLHKIYPGLKPANVYFTIGVFRTNGTTIGNNVFIGSETALADKSAAVSEFPESFTNLKAFLAGSPVNGIVFLNVHEFVHTQQKTTVCDTLLGQSVMEGVAEFLAVKALETPSTTPAIEFGKNNERRVKVAFTTQMFNPSTGFWLYANSENEFGIRDLGYYVGYAIAENFYEKAKDKQLAVKQMIELDYNDLASLARYVDRSGYFPRSVESYEREYEKARPEVLAIKPIRNGGKNEDPNITYITVEFSKVMDKNRRNFEFGPLGEKSSVRIKNVIGFSDDGKSISFEVEPLQPNKRYQLEIGRGFRDRSGRPLKPFLIDFTTTAR